ncbi:hypothetical protein SAMD00019534_105550, partial [Acytostelium subglobosum LB1]|uniref:hypothetical protein n=1 Tax=Acytostelium subglobosum LB1 TaxID=1410327 RepID=UPI000644C057
MLSRLASRITLIQNNRVATRSLSTHTYFNNNNNIYYNRRTMSTSSTTSTSSTSSTSSSTAPQQPPKGGAPPGKGGGGGGGGKKGNNKKADDGCCTPKPKSKQQTVEPSKYKYSTPAVVDMPDDAKYVDSHVHVDQILIRMNMTLDQFPQFAAANFPPQFEACVQVCCDPIALDYTDMLVGFAPIYAAYGVHPHNAKDYTDDIEQKLIERMKHPKTVAWGEMGLDYFYNKSVRDVQLEAFRRQLIAAVKCNKPLVIHSREAEADTLQLLKENVPKDWKIHIHCFTSDANFAIQLLEHFPNLYIGFTGCITFKNSESIRDSLSIVPIDRLLLETDGPYMTPEPFRGKIAHSGHIPMVANIVAAVKEMPLDEVLTQCRINTTMVYGI